MWCDRNLLTNQELLAVWYNDPRWLHYGRRKAGDAVNELRKVDPAFHELWLERSVTVEHIKPRSEGGTNHPENLGAACIPCNSSRGHREIKISDRLRKLREEGGTAKQTRTLARTVYGQPQAFVALVSEGDLPVLPTITRQLEEADMPYEVAEKPTRLSRQMRYASSEGFRYVILCGVRERLANTVLVRDLDTAIQTEIPVNKLQHFDFAPSKGF